jgi:23S rRNA (uracil1939-C5)-methyltransferase
MAHGGEAVGSLASGKTVFVGGALPDETVAVTDIIDRGSWARASLASVIEPSADRVEPPCPYFGSCGGCQWQHAEYGAQLRYKRGIVAGQLAHLGKLGDATVRPTVAPGPPFGYRNKMNFQVEMGVTGQYAAQSHTLVPLDACMLLTPPLAEIYARLGEIPDATKVVLRHGTRTGESIVIVDGSAPDDADDWGASVVERDGQSLRTVIGRGHIHEIVAGVRFRITGPAFFQVNTRAADELVALVAEALQPGSDDVLLDAYAGGGLFSATVGRRAGRVLAVETGDLAVADLVHNLRANGMGHAEVADGPVEEVLAEPVDDWNLVICDPPRTGLGLEAIDALVAPRPDVMAYVSCDPASFARDARLLADRGYHLEWAAPVDQFPQTFHVEVVGKFVARDPSTIEGFG